MAKSLRTLPADAFSHWMRDAKRIAFFVGAGCSVSSGIPAARALVEEHWLPRLRDRHAPLRPDLVSWAQEFLPDYDPAHPAAAYGSIISKLFYWPEERQREIEILCAGKFPSFGYGCLATLVADGSGRFNVVLTTNFDDLLADALYLFTPSKPLIIPHESLASYIRATSTTPVIVKLHGDSRLSPHNTQEETSALEKHVERHVRDLIRERTLVFMGYGGNDRGIARMLEGLPPNAPHGGVFWINGSEPTGVIREWLEAQQAIWVQAADFDELMLLVQNAMHLDHPDRHRFDSVFDQYLTTFYLLLNRITTRKDPSEDGLALRKAAEQSIAFPHRRLRMFGREGIRGVAGEWPLDDLTLWKVGRAFSLTLDDPGKSRPRRVVVGMDTRESGARMAAALAAGIESTGTTVSFAGVIPTPGIGCVVCVGQFDGGIMITASHSVYTFNGLKLFGSGGIRLSSATQAVIEREVDEYYHLSPKRQFDIPVADRSLLDLYASRLNELAKERLGDLNCDIVVDCAHGAVGSLLRRVFQNTNINCKMENEFADGTDINKGCGSLHPKSLATLTLSSRATLGAAFDGDGDRVLFATSEGELVDGDQMMLALASYLKKAGRLVHDAVVGTLMSSLSLERALAERGIKLRRTHVGDTHVLDLMRSEGYVFGGEPSGNLVFSDVSVTGDGIVTLLEVLCMIRTTGQTLKQLISEFTRSSAITLDIPASMHRPLDSLSKVNEAISLATEDLGAHGRVVVRYSQTEPLVRVTVESDDESKLQLHSAAIACAVEAAIGVPGSRPSVAARVPGTQTPMK